MELIAQRNLYVALFVAGIFPFLINGVINAIIFPHPWLYWTFEIVSWVALPIVVFSLATRRGGLRFGQLGIHACVRGRRNVPVLLLLCLLAGPLDLFVYKHSLDFFSRIVPGTSLFEYESVVPANGVLRIVVALYLGITAGVVEELYFRGFFFKISQFFSAPLAVYLTFSPVLFALIHWEGAPANVPATYVLGLVHRAHFCGRPQSVATHHRPHLY